MCLVCVMCVVERTRTCPTNDVAFVTKMAARVAIIHSPRYRHNSDQNSITHDPSKRRLDRFIHLLFPIFKALQCRPHVYGHFVCLSMDVSLSLSWFYSLSIFSIKFIDLKSEALLKWTLFGVLDIGHPYVMRYLCLLRDMSLKN